MDTYKVAVHPLRTKARLSCRLTCLITAYLLSPLLYADTVKSFFFINGEFSHAVIEIRVNDIPVFFNTSDDISGIALPINNALVKGRNKIKMVVSPATPNTNFVENSSLSLKIARTLSIVPNADKKTIRSLKIDDLSNKRDILISNTDLTLLDDKILYTTEINVGNLFPRWTWQNGMDIKPSHSEFESLMKAYQHLHELLLTKNKNELEKQLSIKIREYAQYYFTGSIDKARNHVTYDDILADKTAKLIPLWKNNMHLQIFASGKLARIADPDGDSPIVFLLGKDGNTAYVVKLLFMKNQRGEWVVVR